MFTRPQLPPSNVRVEAKAQAFFFATPTGSWGTTLVTSIAHIGQRKKSNRGASTGIRSSNVASGC
jgi:hypothetical protein